jgi:hypothetical protein
LTNAGAPCLDDGEELGIHGRLSNTPATDVATMTSWKNEQCVFAVSGKIREQRLFKHNLLLTRSIEVGLGTSVITFRDAVENEGSYRTPLMMLYHINMGWPLLDEGAEIVVNDRAMKPRDAEAEKGVSSALNIPAPVFGYKEQVFYHDMIPDHEGYAVAVLKNKSLGLSLFVRYRQKELPRFIEWKMVGQGEYVLGFEPANCQVGGRAKERELGTLQFLEPGEKKEFHLQIGVLEGDGSMDQINEAVQRP